MAQKLLTSLSSLVFNILGRRRRLVNYRLGSYRCITWRSERSPLLHTNSGSLYFSCHIIISMLLVATQHQRFSAWAAENVRSGWLLSSLTWHVASCCAKQQSVIARALRPPSVLVLMRCCNCRLNIKRRCQGNIIAPCNFAGLIGNTVINRCHVSPLQTWSHSKCWQRGANKKQAPSFWAAYVIIKWKSELLSILAFPLACWSNIFNWNLMKLIPVSVIKKKEKYECCSQAAQIRQTAAFEEMWE